MTMYNVDATELIEEVAKELQKIDTITPPQWASFVKTGASRERPPTRSDWWYVRAASILRKVRMKGPIGVSKLKLFYGGKKNRGHKPERFRKGSGNIIRKILQQLEKAELIKKDKKGVHKGKVVTPKGIKLMDNIAKKITGNKPVEKKPEVNRIKVLSPIPRAKPEDSKNPSGIKAAPKDEVKKEVPKSQKPKVSGGLEAKSQSTAEKKEAPKAEVKQAPKSKEQVPTAAELAAKKSSEEKK